MSGEAERGSKPRWGWIAFGIGLTLCVAAGAAAGILLGQNSGGGDGEALRRATALALDTDRLNDDALALSAAIEDAIAQEELEGEAAALRTELAGLELRSARIRGRARSQLAMDGTTRPVADRSQGAARAKHSVRKIDATLSVFERQLVPKLESVLNEQPETEAPSFELGSSSAVLAGVTRALEDQDETLEDVTSDLIEAHQDTETSVGGSLLDGDRAEAAGCRRVEEPEPKSVSLEAPERLVLAGEEITAVVETSCGSFEIALDSLRAPETVNSFVFLAEQGFYDGLTFHRAVPGFVIQGGDPLGDGTGGPGYSVDERPPADLSYTEGVVAMAKASSEPPGRSGSQFFVVLAGDAGLPPEYALLGEVSSGMDVVRRIGRLGTDNERPRRTVSIEELTVEQR